VLPFHAAVSHYINVDVPLVLLSVLTLWPLVRYLEEGGRRTLWLAGALAGLATSAKYPGVVLCFSVAVAYGLSARRGPVVDLIVAEGLSAVTFFVGSPYVILGFHQFSTDFHTEAVHMQGVHPGYDFHVAGWQFRPLLYQLVAQWPLVMSWPLYVLGLAGLIWAARREDARLRLLVLGYLAPWCVVVGTATVVFPRYALPFVTGLVVVGAAWLDRCLASRRKHWSRLAGIALAGSVGYAALMTATLDRKLEPQAAALASRWLDDHAPRGSRVAVAIFFQNVPFAPSLDVCQVQTVEDWQGSLEWADYVVVSSEYALALRRAPEPEFVQRRFLERLEEGPEYGRVADFAPPPFLNENGYAALDPYFHNHFHSHRIEIFARAAPAPAADAARPCGSAAR